MKQQKFKSALLVMLTLVLVSATAVAITWAAKTEDKFGKVENTFTDNPDISLAIAENTWDGLDYDGKNPAGGDTIPATADDLKKSGAFTITLPNGTDKIDDPAKLGKNLADPYSPGAVIPKNPSLQNNTTSPSLTAPENSFDNKDESVDEWVAMKVTYKVTIPPTYYTAAASQDSGHNGSTETKDLAMNDTTTGAYASKVVTFDSYAHFETAVAQVRHATADNKSMNKNDSNFLAADFLTGTGEGSKNWQDISAENDSNKTKTLFMYNTKLVPNGKTQAGEVSNTENLFDAVYVNDNKKYCTVLGNTQQLYEIDLTGAYYYSENTKTTIPDGTIIYVNTMPTFEIDLKGYAVQGDNVADLDAAKTELEALRAAENS